MSSMIDEIARLFVDIPVGLRSRIVLVGSVNLYLQGVGVIPEKDIDFVTDYKTVQELEKLFNDKVVKFCVSPEGDDYLPFSYLFINVDGYEIEFFDAVNYGKSYYFGEFSNEKTVILPKLDVMGLNLETELAVYRKSGKEEKIRAIEAYLIPQSE